MKDYTSYWNMVLGADRDAADVVREFELTDEAGLDEWLGESEVAAAAAGTDEDAALIRELSEQFHAVALQELKVAVVAASGD